MHIENIYCKYEQDFILKGLSQTLKDGELLVLLGKSGCGKSTLLKIIAGIISPNEGKILIDNEDITSLPPQYRNIGYVPQAQVLFPHMSVRDNIEFGLKARKIPKHSYNERVEKFSELSQIHELLNRFPRELSGGQQQRVALARALVVEPDILLLDEPLSSIDRSAREELALVIRRINQETNTPVIYVTHNHEEAQLIADRIAVIDEGVIVQEGTYYALYNSPKTYHVAAIMDKPNIWPLKHQETDIFYPLPNESHLGQNPVGIHVPPEKIKFSNIPSKQPNGDKFSLNFGMDPVLTSSEIKLVGILDSIQILPNNSFQYLFHFSKQGSMKLLKIWTSLSPEKSQLQLGSEILLSVSINELIFF